jgi:hypothetical protein
LVATAQHRRALKLGLARTVITMPSVVTRNLGNVDQLVLLRPGANATMTEMLTLALAVDPVVAQVVALPLGLGIVLTATKTIAMAVKTTTAVAVRMAVVTVVQLHPVLVLLLHGNSRPLRLSRVTAGMAVDMVATVRLLACRPLLDFHHLPAPQASTHRLGWVEM